MIPVGTLGQHLEEQIQLRRRLDDDLHRRPVDLHRGDSLVSGSVVFQRHGSRLNSHVLRHYANSYTQCYFSDSANNSVNRVRAVCQK